MARKRRRRNSPGTLLTETAGARAPGPGGSRRARLLLAGIGLVAVLATVAAVALWRMHGSSAPDGPRAAIIDELAITDPNPAFIDRARNLLESAGYSVDYYGADKVTVDLYSRLPSHHYAYIVIRSHSYGSRVAPDGSTVQLNVVGLFTSEPYSSSKHVDDQRAHTLDVAFFPAKEERYFGINQDFVTKTMHGTLDGATVILMGCDGLSNDGLARAMIDKGAKAFVSWDREVSAAHTDLATGHVLTHLLADDMTPHDSVARTMEEVGEDPIFHSRLLAYP